MLNTSFQLMLFLIVIPRKDALRLTGRGKKGAAKPPLFYPQPQRSQRLFEPNVRNLPFYVPVSLHGVLNASILLFKIIVLRRVKTMFLKPDYQYIIKYVIITNVRPRSTMPAYGGTSKTNLA